MLKERKEQEECNTWDLSDIFVTVEIWHTEVTNIRPRINQIGKYKGKLSSKLEILNLLKLIFSCQETLEKIYTYAHCLSDQDATNSDNKKILEIASSLWAEFSIESSFLAPELLKQSDLLQDELLNDLEFKEYKVYLSEIFREKKHILNESEEVILSEATESLSSARDIFGQLTNADFSFGEITEDGKVTTLSHGNLITFLTKSDRNIRKLAYEQYLGVYQSHSFSLSSIYLANLKKDTFYTKVRKFNSSRERSLFSDNISETVYDQLIDTLSANLEPLHDYYLLRNKILNLDKQYIYDTYVPLADETPLKFSYDESVELISESLRPLGDQYVKILIQGLKEERWVDKFENKGKRSGAYSSGCYGSKPFILMNYQDSGIDSLFTLAHEAGHSMHTYFSNKTQPYPTHSYTIFVAEVASTLNEILLNSYLINKYSNNKTVQLYLINHLIDGIKATFFRQTMFAEFEHQAHQLSDSKAPITLDTLIEIHFKLQTKYFGSGVNISINDAIECLRIPHFYSSFYVYKYATGMAAALSLSHDILKNDSSAIKRYLTFLSSGSSKFSLDLLKDAGVDLESKDPILKTITFFENNLAAFKKMLLS